jgi:hypothetical protein
MGATEARKKFVKKGFFLAAKGMTAWKLTWKFSSFTCSRLPFALRFQQTKNFFFCSLFQLSDSHRFIKHAATNANLPPVPTGCHSLRVVMANVFLPI